MVCNFPYKLYDVVIYFIGVRKFLRFRLKLFFKKVNVLTQNYTYTVRELPHQKEVTKCRLYEKEFRTRKEFLKTSPF